MTTINSNSNIPAPISHDERFAAEIGPDQSLQSAAEEDGPGRTTGTPNSAVKASQLILGFTENSRPWFELPRSSRMGTDPGNLRRVPETTVPLD